MKFNNRITLTLVAGIFALMALISPVFAGTVTYTPDALILPAEGITKIRVDEVLGSTGQNDDWPAGAPDGYVVKLDSPYYSTAKYGGQDILSKDMQTNKVQKYPNYEANPWKGKPWDKIPAYYKLAAHMEKPQPDALVAWTIQIEDEVQTTVAEYNAWLQSRTKTGYDDGVVAEFVGEQIVVNTKYMYGPVNASAGVLLRASGSEGPGIVLTLYVPLASKDAKDKFVADFTEWQNKPKLTKTIDTQKTVEYVK